MEVLVLKCGNKLIAVIGLMAVITALVASVATLFAVLDKKKRDNEELEHYLDCAIQ